MQSDNLLAPLVQLGKALMACIVVAHAKKMHCFAEVIKTSVCRVYSGQNEVYTFFTRIRLSRTNARGRLRPFCPSSGTSPAGGPAEVKLVVAIRALGSRLWSATISAPGHFRK